MLRHRLFTATAAVALLAGSAAYAQDAMTPAPEAAPEAVAAPVEAPAAQAPEAAPAPVPQSVAPSAATAAPAAPAETAAAPAATNTVIDVLQANGQFTTLLAALDAAQLTETLKSAGAISIFAPTDAAFAALPEADRTRLMDPANVNELRQTLLYHVIVADVNSSQIEGARGGVETAANTEVQLDGTGDAIKVDAATVLTADIDASNGAVFAIDQVLSPAASQVASGDAEEAAPAPAAPPAEEAAPAATAPMAEEAAPTPPPAATTPPAAEMAPTAAPVEAPAEAPVTAPSGEPATSVTTTASPPVANPTDGQVDGSTTEEPEATTPEA